MKGLILALLLSGLLCEPSKVTDPYEGNPFYVDPTTVKKDPTKWTMTLKNHHASSNDKGNPELTMAWLEIESYDEYVLHLKMNDKNGNRWEAPIVNPNSRAYYQPVSLDKMGFEYFDDPFTFKITSPKTGDLLVSTKRDSFGSLKYYDKYIEFGLWYCSSRMFGLGERVTEKFQLCPRTESCTYTMFNQDQVSPLDDGNAPGGKNIYGSQPFYLIQTKRGDFFGVLFFNMNDQDIVIVPREGGAANVYHKTIGGIIDTYFFYNGPAELILQKYHALVGRPYLPPFWTLGFHQCRYGWYNLAKVKDVVARFDQSDLPLEVVWADIDYMKAYADFTVDPDRYGGLKEFVEELHSKKMRWVPIIDAGLKIDPNDPYYKKGMENEAFIKSAWTKKTLTGKVWPGPAVFPDWYTPYMTTLWHEGLADLYKLAAFDGIWIDMNDVSNFCDGECSPTGESMTETRSNLRRSLTADPHDPHEFDNLPYYPGSKDPARSTLSMTGYHRPTNDYEDFVLKEYNVHNLFCLYEAKATFSFMAEKQQRRPFVLTRSQVPGSGMFTSLWLGDNWSRWEYMRYSINGMYSYQMFGMPLVGADMCGFLENTTEELCARWMQMGAFYPFSRNHNDIHASDQEPYVFGERVATASRNAIRQKYSILRYYYTKLFEVSLNGGTLMRPLFFEYPNDPKAFEKTEYTFMVGPSLLVAPVLHPSTYNTYPYVANEHWYDMFWRVRQYKYDPDKNEGQQLTLPGGFEYVSVLLRGGGIIPFQAALENKVRRTEFLKVLPMEMVIGPDHNGVATGTLYVDSEESINPLQTKDYRYLKMSFSMTNGELTVEVLNDYKEHFKFEYFTKLTILGAEAWAERRKACIFAKDGTRLEVSGSYNSGQTSLTFSESDSDLYWSNIIRIDFKANC